MGDWSVGLKLLEAMVRVGPESCEGQNRLPLAKLVKVEGDFELGYFEDCLRTDMPG